VMHGRKTCRMVWPVKKVSGGEVEGPFDSRLYSILADLRGKLAKEEGCPAFMIFSNRALEGLARVKPTSKEESLVVPGIGPAKAEQYVERFLVEIRAFAS
ncbi:MAG: HRDC domain-containing protein, partial [Verrucomicrobiota bacterium]